MCLFEPGVSIDKSVGEALDFVGKVGYKPIGYNE